MKTTKAFIAISMMALLAASCSSESTTESSNGISHEQVIRFATTPQASITSRAVNVGDNLQDKKFIKDTPINVYLNETTSGNMLLPYGQTSVSGNYYKFTVGDAYTGSEAGTDFSNYQYLNAPNDYIFQYPSEKSTTVDVYAIAPATSAKNVDKSFTTFSVEDNQTDDASYRNSDLICATAQGKAKGDGTIFLKFGHQLSKIIVKLNIADNIGFELGENTTIKVLNTNSSVALTHAASGLTLGETSNPKTIIMGGYNTEGTAAIIVPQKVAANTKLLQITLGEAGPNFSYTTEGEKEFEAGKVYTFNLTLTADLLTLVSMEVTDWADGGTTTGNATLD